MGRWVQENDVRIWISHATLEQITSMIELAEGQALAVAPPLATLTLDETQQAAIKGVLIAAIRRWWDAGSGAVASHTVGPFSETMHTTAVVGQFYPSEVKALRRIGAAGNVYSFSMDPDDEPVLPSWVINRPLLDEEEP